MKKLLILFLLPVVALANGFGSGFANSTNNSGLGLGTFDSLYALHRLRVGTYLKFGGVAGSDTIWFKNSRYLTGNAAGNYLGTDYLRIESDALFPAGISGCGNIAGISQNTITGFSKISNSTTVGVKVASDSLIITPEGGIAVLMQNVWAADSTLYRGNPVVVVGAKKTVSGSSAITNLGFGVCYSDSIKNNAWGYIAISGISYAAVGNAGVGTLYGIGTNTNRIINASGSFALDQQMWGQFIDTMRIGKNARGDSLVMMRVQPSYHQAP
jgi:hypothetical protein